MGFSKQLKESELSARTKRLDGGRDAAIRSTGFVRTWTSDHDKHGRKPRCSRIELRLREGCSYCPGRCRVVIALDRKLAVDRGFRQRIVEIRDRTVTGGT